MDFYVASDTYKNVNNLKKEGGMGNVRVHSLLLLSHKKERTVKNRYNPEQMVELAADLFMLRNASYMVGGGTSNIFKISCELRSVNNPLFLDTTLSIEKPFFLRPTYYVNKLQLIDESLVLNRWQDSVDWKRWKVSSVGQKEKSTELKQGHQVENRLTSVSQAFVEVKSNKSTYFMPQFAVRKVYHTY